MVKFIQNTKAFEMRAKLLNAMQKNASFDSMGREELLTAANACNIDESFALSLFANGARAVIADYYWQGLVNRAEINLRKQQGRPQIEPKGITARVEFGVNVFFAGAIAEKGDFSACYEAHHIHSSALQQTAATLFMPHQIDRFFKHIFGLADVIWKFAGDKSTDFNHYTKRFLLAEILVETLLYNIQDSSADRQETQDFITRRLKGTVSLSKKIGKVKSFAKAQGESMAKILKIISPYSTLKPRYDIFKRDLGQKDTLNRQNFRVSPVRHARILGKHIVKNIVADVRNRRSFSQSF